MGRAPCCDKANVKKGPWSPEEDAKLKEFIEKNGTGGNWIALPQKAGLKRCGKSCRLRWLNYLRPNIKHGEFSEEEDRIICSLFATIGSRWSIIAAQLPGRTDNDIKNYWNTKLKKKLMGMVIPSPSNQRKPAFFSHHHFHEAAAATSSSLLSLPQNSSSNLSQLYRDHFTSSSGLCYTSFVKSLTAGFDSIPPNIQALYNTNNINNIQPFAVSNINNPQPSFLLTQEGLMNNTNNNSILMFGGGEPSCSSSDGSCSQISYGKEIKQEDLSGFQGLIMSSTGLEDNQKFILEHYGSNINNNGVSHLHGPADAPPHLSTNNTPWGQHDHHQENKGNGFLGNSQLQYDIEEVKQLISSSNGNCNSSTNLFFFNDENKTNERPMYFY